MMSKHFTYPVLCGMIAFGAAALAAPSGKQALETPGIAEPGAAYTQSFHLGENQLRVLVPGAFAAAAVVDDPFAAVAEPVPARPQLKENFNVHSAAASARDVLVSKLGVPIRSGDEVEITFRDATRMVVSAPPKLMNLIGLALDDLLVAPQARLKLHVFRLQKPQTLADLIGEGRAGGQIDGDGFAALKKQILAAGGKVESMPEVVTRNGQRCKIEMVREFIYPTEYDPPEIPNGGEKGIEVPLVAAPANPTAFDVRNVGLTWEVEPLVRVDGSVVLGGSIEDTQFLGNINYGSPIRGVADIEGEGEQAVVLTENEILQPVFSVTRIPTEMTLAAGGGMVVLTGFTPLEAEQVEAVLEEDKRPAEGEGKIRPASKIFRLFVIEAEVLRDR